MITLLPDLSSREAANALANASSSSKLKKNYFTINNLIWQQLIHVVGCLAHCCCCCCCCLLEGVVFSLEPDCDESLREAAIANANASSSV